MNTRDNIMDGHGDLGGSGFAVATGRLIDVIVGSNAVGQNAVIHGAQRSHLCTHAARRYSARFTLLILLFQTN